MTIRTTRQYSVLFFLLWGASLPFSMLPHAHAASAVGSPKVSAGATSIEARVGYSDDDSGSSNEERLRSRIHIDHGVNDFYAMRLIAATDKRKDDSLEADSLTLENRFYLLKAKEYGFDFGTRLSYKLKDGDKKPDSVGVGFYELVPLEKIELRANQLFSHEVGEDSQSGIHAELRFQATSAFSENHKAGLESFHAFGNLSELSGYSDQSHTLGPVFKGPLLQNIKYEAGYRAGISDSAPDHTIKLHLGYSF